MSRRRVSIAWSGRRLACALSLVFVLSSSVRAEPGTDVVKALSLIQELDVEGAGELLKGIAPETPGYGYTSALYLFHRGAYQELSLIHI